MGQTTASPTFRILFLFLIAIHSLPMSQTIAINCQSFSFSVIRCKLDRILFTNETVVWSFRNDTVIGCCNNLSCRDPEETNFEFSISSNMTSFLLYTKGPQVLDEEDYQMCVEVLSEQEEEPSIKTCPKRTGKVACVWVITASTTVPMVSMNNAGNVSTIDVIRHNEYKNSMIHNIYMNSSVNIALTTDMQKNGDQNQTIGPYNNKTSGAKNMHVGQYSKSYIALIFIPIMCFIFGLYLHRKCQNVPQQILIPRGKDNSRILNEQDDAAPIELWSRPLSQDVCRNGSSSQPRDVWWQLSPSSLQDRNCKPDERPSIAAGTHLSEQQNTFEFIPGERKLRNDSCRRTTENQHPMPGDAVILENSQDEAIRNDRFDRLHYVQEENGNYRYYGDSIDGSSTPSLSALSLSYSSISVSLSSLSSYEDCIKNV